jgi:hypothetical protein
VCPESFANCRAWRPAGGRTFATDRAPLALDPSHPGDLARTARSSLSARVRSGPQRFELISERRQPLVKMPGRQLLFGGQFLAAPRGSRIDVDLSMELRGESGRALVSHDLVSRNKRRHYSRRHQPLQAGETLTIRYSVTLDSAVDVLECRVWVKEPIGDGLELYFHEARLEVHPPALGRTPGMKEREYQIATR